MAYSKLVVVESPSKAKTIEKYLGKDYKVMASVGHVIDLPKSKLGVDVEEGTFEPEFATIRGKGKVIKQLKKAMPKDGEVILAMDLDREGEAIAWHVSNALKLEDPKRIIFSEITKNAVTEAMKKPRKINQDLVDAQIARRVLDRLVGYKVSGVLWEKIWYGLSAGRVQSPALRLIVEREREIEAFDPEEYWRIYGEFKESGNVLKPELIKIDKEKLKISNEKDAKGVEKDIKGKELNVVEVKSRKKTKHPYAPFNTSKLQQSANSVLGYTAKRTMGIAQSLYQAGYITYMRTDSYNLSSDAVKAIRAEVEKAHGKKYLSKKARVFKTKSKNAQEAHEAIRPTDMGVTNTRVKADLGADAAKLYQMIYDRALATQMAAKESEVKTVKLEVEGDSGKVHLFRVGAEKVLFDGFRKVWGSSQGNDDIPEIDNIEEGDNFKLEKVDLEQHFTKPKPRYNDASLVKALEKYGIGRPSTYATIISTIQDRGYVEKQGKNLHPTDVGRVVTDFLKDNFNRLIDYEYTANVENDLDKIAMGDVEYKPFIEQEYKPLVSEIKDVKSVKKEDVVILEDSEEECPDCGGKMVVRLGRYGKFLSCAKFPECKGMKDLDGGEDNLDTEKYRKPEECPECGAALKLKTGKYGQFWACERYPDCKGTVPMLLQEECPESGHPLVERKGRWGKTFTGCSGYPDCKYIKKKKKGE